MNGRLKRDAVKGKYRGIAESLGGRENSDISSLVFAFFWLLSRQVDDLLISHAMVYSAPSSV